MRKKSVKKWTKLKNGLFGWRVVRESRLEKGESSSHKTTHANVLDFRWQPKLQLVDKGVNTIKLGKTFQAIMSILKKTRIWGIIILTLTRT